MYNAWGSRIYSIKDVIQDKKVEESIREIFYSVLLNLGISPKGANRIVDDCLKESKNYSHIYGYEREAHERLKKEGVNEEIPKRLVERAEIMYKQVAPHLLEGSVLDLGCGDGRVGELLYNNHPGAKRLELADIYRHPNIDNVESPDLKFHLFCEEDDLPFRDSEFDNNMALTVFHHSDYPLKTIKESHRVIRPGGRLLAIESVYGVSERGVDDCHDVKTYLSITPEQQRLVNIFFDHFYNRILHYREDPKMKVKTPFNFRTPEDWNKILENNGFEIKDCIKLGLDQPIVPEYHTLHVAKVRK
jgi:SAM-dependent methyltransferase